MSIIYFPRHFFPKLFLSFFLVLIFACSDDTLPVKKLVIKPVATRIKPVVTRAIGIKPKFTREQPFNSSFTWLLINTKQRLLEVKEREKTIATFRKVSIGRRGAGFKNRRGDKITPLGTYKIGWVNRQSRFKTFYGFTYPSIENAREALKRAIISDETYGSIVSAHVQNKVPPQNTALGGRIGLHGVGNGSQSIHELWDWTSGCVAVTNAQIDQLGYWIFVGMTVKVK
jgi:murein L,D-transpeptidase YafK